MLVRTTFLILLLLVVPACGGGSKGGSAGQADDTMSGGQGGGGASGGGETGLPANPGPQVALLVSNGHSPLVPDYMGVTMAPQLAAAIASAGYTVETTTFTDDAVSYAAFVAKLGQIRDTWINGVKDPTLVVVVGHSHGVVRSHAAVRAVPDCPVELLVDLDGSSVGWSLLTHGGENTQIGGAPEGAYNLGVQILCPAYPAVTSAGGNHDLEDVVFPHVVKGYEVRSGELVINPANLTQFIPYDERWNARTDGTTTGLTCVYSGLGHSEAALAGGITMTGATNWILAQLATP
jgi:hypothetical protein